MRALKLTYSMVRSLLARPTSRPNLAIVALAGALSMTGACISVHAHRPVAAANYHHQHRLECDHVVAATCSEAGISARRTSLTPAMRTSIGRGRDTT
jgi:hypothetical protein